MSSDQMKVEKLGNFSGILVGFVDKSLILPGLNFEHTSYIVSDSLPISTRPRSIRYNYYIYGSAVLTVSYLTDISVYNSKIIAVHSRSSIQNRNITSGCVDLPFKFDIKIVFRALFEGRKTKAVLLSDVFVEYGLCNDMTMYELTKSMKEATPLFPQDRLLSSKNTTFSHLIDQRDSIDLSLCPSCRNHDFSIFADPLTECYCKERNDVCVYCTCSNISTFISIRNFRCSFFRLKARDNQINVEFLNSSIGDISLSVGLDNYLLFNFNETQITSFTSVVIRGSYHFIHIWEGILNLFQSPFDFYVVGKMRNFLTHYSVTNDGLYLAENNFEDVSRINVESYAKTRVSTNFSNCNISEQTPIYIESKIVDLSRNRIRFFLVNYKIEVLYIQHNLLEAVVQNDATKETTYYPLSILDMSFNRIRKLLQEDFKYYVLLISLNLSGNQIQDIEENTFSDLSMLVSIDLSGNKISVIRREHFRSLGQLQFVYIQKNNIFQVSSDIFHGLVSMKYLQVESFSICCVKPQSLYNIKCVAPSTEISSCDHLIAVPILNVAIWYMALFALFGNIIVIIYIVSSLKKKVSITYFILTLNLSFADLLMGVYLFIIAMVNLRYTGTYGLMDYTWRHSWLCTLAGILATVSSETSAFIVFLITVDRFLAIKYSISKIRLTKRGAIGLCAFIWLTSWLLATLPMLIYENFYSKSGICISLPLSVLRKTGWRYSMIIFVGLNALLFIGILIGQIAIFVEALNVGKVVRTSKIRTREISLAKTLVAIIVTDMLCWIPIGVIGMVTFYGEEFPSDVYAWIIVLVLPVNSALNPILYTMTAVIRQKRQSHIHRLTQENLILRKQLDTLRSSISSASTRR
nr:G-protein coupled receptor GRL101 [Crassostrea gigas]